MPGLTFDGEGLKVSSKSKISRSFLKYGMTVSISQIIKKDFSLGCKVILLSIKAKILYHASMGESTSPHAIIKRRRKDVAVAPMDQFLLYSLKQVKNYHNSLLQITNL